MHRASNTGAALARLDVLARGAVAIRESWHHQLSLMGWFGKLCPFRV